jgi:hypothetical protein
MCERCEAPFSPVYSGRNGTKCVASWQRFCSDKCRKASSAEAWARRRSERRKAERTLKPKAMRRTKPASEKLAVLRAWRRRPDVAERLRASRNARELRKRQARDRRFLERKADAVWRSQLRKRVGAELLADETFMELAVAARRLRQELLAQGIRVNE